jgi:hypothetical protein
VHAVWGRRSRRAEATATASRIALGICADGVSPRTDESQAVPTTVTPFYRRTDHRRRCRPLHLWRRGLAAYGNREDRRSSEYTIGLVMATRLQALLLCDLIVRGPDGKNQLQGVFDVIFCRDFPAQHASLWLYFRFPVQQARGRPSSRYTGPLIWPVFTLTLESCWRPSLTPWPRLWKPS